MVRPVVEHVLDDQPARVRGPAQARAGVPGARPSSRQAPERRRRRRARGRRRPPGEAGDASEPSWAWGGSESTTTDGGDDGWWSRTAGHTRRGSIASGTSARRGAGRSCRGGRGSGRRALGRRRAAAGPRGRRAQGLAAQPARARPPAGLALAARDRVDRLAAGRLRRGHADLDHDRLCPVRRDVCRAAAAGAARAAAADHRGAVRGPAGRGRRVPSRRSARSPWRCPSPPCSRVGGTRDHGSAPRSSGWLCHDRVLRRDGRGRDRGLAPAAPDAGDGRARRGRHRLRRQRGLTEGPAHYTRSHAATPRSGGHLGRGPGVPARAAGDGLGRARRDDRRARAPRRGDHAGRERDVPAARRATVSWSPPRAAGWRSPTPGRAAADAIFRRHALLEWLLTSVVGLTWAESDVEAMRLQGALSPRVEAKLDELLGHPGDVPARQPDRPRDRAPAAGRRPACRELESGSKATVLRITEEAEEDAGLLSYLEARALTPARTSRSSRAASRSTP